MSADETRRVLQDYADAWLARDPDLFDRYADDVVFHYFGTTDLAGDHVGKDACLTAMITASVRAARSDLEILDVQAGDAGGAIVVRERLTRDGASRVLERVLRYVVADGKIVECWLYDADQRLVDQLWAP